MLKILLLLLPFALSGLYDNAGFSDKFKAGVSLGLINATELSEVSGMVASRKNKGNFWVINDSGNQPMIYLIDPNAKIVHSAWLKDCRNFDWEDLTIRTDPKTGASQLIVADIGDNVAFRDYISLLVFDEPDWTTSKEDTIDSIVEIKLRYEDGPRDAETILADPIDNKLYVITKREEQVRLYEVPESATSNNPGTMVFTGVLPFHNITSGDISRDGSEILLKSYNAVFYWQRSKNQSLGDALVSPHELLNYKPEPQGESISWSIDGTGFYTLSEKSWADRQVLLFYERN
jgi:hypothetical protein